MRKTFLIAPVVIAALALSGCSTSGGGGDAGSNTLKISWTTLEQPGIAAALKLFEKEHPEISVKLTTADIDAYQASLRTQLFSGTGPDVFYAWPGNGNPGAIQVLQPGGYLTDLSKESWAKTIPAAISDSTQVDGKTLMLPMAFHGIGMVMNDDTMKAEGFQTPDTWSGVISLCKAATAKGLVTFALGTQDVWTTIMVPYALAATAVYVPEPDIDKQLAAGETTFAQSKGYQTTFEKTKEMLDAGCFGKDPNGVTFAAANTQIATGKALGTIQITATLGQTREAAPKANLVLTPLPATDDASQTRMSGGAGGGPALNAKAKNVDAARTFLAFMATPAAQNAYASAVGALPAIPNDAYKVTPTVANVLKFYSDNRVSPLMDQYWPNADVQQALRNGTQGLLGGQTQTADILEAMDKAYKQ